MTKSCDCTCVHTRPRMKNSLCCQKSEECSHNSTPERIEQIMAEAKAAQAAKEKEWVKHLEPFDMKEWYARIKG